MDVGKPPNDGTRVVVLKVGQIQRVHNLSSLVLVILYSCLLEESWKVF